jgi:hypothetical protein
MLKRAIRSVGMALAPQLTLELLAARSQRHVLRVERESGQLAASHAFVARHGRQVLGGPFAGLTYPESSARERNVVQRLLGSYECELHPWIEEIVRTDHPMLIDVGTSDGYYAAGFARRMPGTRVVGFDTDRWARRVTQDLFAQNALANARVDSMCSPQWLRNHLPPGSLVFSDCEGYEAVLLDPKAAPVLLACDILVELHEKPAPGIAELLRRRFAATHDIRTVAFGPRRPEDWPALEAVPEPLRSVAIDEHRGHAGQQVMFLTRRP